MKVSWITIGGLVRQPDGSVTSNYASVRYRVMAPIRALPGHQHMLTTALAATPTDTLSAAIQADVVIFSKSLLADNVGLAERARAAGTPVIFDVCDDHFSSDDLGAHYRAMAGLAHQVVCNTPQMAQAAAPHTGRPPVVVEDPYEGVRGEPRFAPGPTMKLLWFGHPLNLDSLQAALGDVAEFAERRPVAVTVLTQVNDRLLAVCQGATEALAPRFSMTARPWSIEAQREALAACDAVIIPSLPGAAKRAKSSNRMVEALWAGRPVVAQPIPAYEPFAAWMPVTASLKTGLADLLDREPQVPALIAQAQAHIAAHYAPEVIGRQWDAVLRGVSGGAPSD